MGLVDGNMRILSYNVCDRKCDWDERFAAIGRFVVDQDVDVCILIEVVPLALLNAPWVNESGYNLAVGERNRIQFLSRWPIDEYRELTRFASLCSTGGQRFMAVHLNSCPPKVQARWGQLNQIMDEDFTVLVGDFNFHFNTEASALVLPDLCDVWDQRTHPDDPGWTYDYRTNGNCAFTVRKRIDRAYVRQWMRNRAKLFVLNKVFWSDHYPILLELELEPEPEPEPENPHQ